jgi:hypothetical protein
MRNYKDGKHPLLLMKIGTFGSYLQSQAELPEKAREQPLAITISREVGAGGRTVAELLGQRLTAAEKMPAPSLWVVFDANLAKQVLEDHKLPPTLERFMTEDAQLLPVEAIVEEVLGLHPSGWTLVQHTTQTMLGPHYPGRARRQRHHRTPSERISRAVGGAACDANWACRRILPPE